MGDITLNTKTLPKHSFKLAGQLNTLLDGKSTLEILNYALTWFGDKLLLASSFGPEDVVLIHLAAQLDQPIRIMTLDTGRLHEETYTLMDTIRSRYGVELEVYFPQPDAVEALVRQTGFHSFYASIDARRQCCGIRKVEPLKRALSTANAWITGMRQEQSPTRTAIGLFEYDLLNGELLKINPLKDWSTDDLWAFIRENDIPYNPLHDKGFASIGCAPCTRAIQPGESERAGRWWWENPEDKECGLHARNNTSES